MSPIEKKCVILRDLKILETNFNAKLELIDFRGYREGWRGSWYRYINQKPVQSGEIQTFQ